jgi:hypothetical protein
MKPSPGVLQSIVGFVIVTLVLFCGGTILVVVLSAVALALAGK